MTERLYIVVFDQLDPSFDPAALRDAVSSNPQVAHWWNHIPNCFLISCTQSAAELTQWLRRQTGEVGFFVMEADPHNSEGYLPTRSWEWIRRREREKVSEPTL